MALLNILQDWWYAIVTFVFILIALSTLSVRKANKDDRREQDQLDSSDDMPPQ